MGFWPGAAEHTFQGVQMNPLIDLKNYRRKCTFSPYILILPLLVPKSIKMFHFSPFR